MGKLTVSRGNTIDLPAPAVPCDPCMDARCVQFSDMVTAVYCEHRQCAAVYVATIRRWAVYSPIGEEEFIRTLGLERATPERAN